MTHQGCMYLHTCSGDGKQIVIIASDFLEIHETFAIKKIDIFNNRKF